MTRQTLSNGRWFNRDKADEYEEGTRWDGSNHISLATGSQWNHEALFRTRSGNWILRAWSQWQGSSESWTEISKEDAARWFVDNELEPHADFAAEFAALEMT